MKHTKRAFYLGISSLFLLAFFLACNVKKYGYNEYSLKKAPKKDLVLYFDFIQGDSIVSVDTFEVANRVYFEWMSLKCGCPYRLNLPAPVEIVGADADWICLMFPNEKLLWVYFGEY